MDGANIAENQALGLIRLALFFEPGLPIAHLLHRRRGRAALHALQPIGAGVRGPAHLRATVYATGLRNVSAFALDRAGRLWATTAGNSDRAGDGLYLVARPEATPLKVVSGLTTRSA
jgi:hypothetical protein